MPYDDGWSLTAEGVEYRGRLVYAGGDAHMLEWCRAHATEFRAHGEAWMQCGDVAWRIDAPRRVQAVRDASGEWHAKVFRDQGLPLMDEPGTLAHAMCDADRLHALAVIGPMDTWTRLTPTESEYKGSNGDRATVWKTKGGTYAYRAFLNNGKRIDGVRIQTLESAQQEIEAIFKTRVVPAQRHPWRLQPQSASDRATQEPQASEAPSRAHPRS